MPDGLYHTGFKRDTYNDQIFRRISDGAEVQLDGWKPDYPVRRNWVYGFSENVNITTVREDDLFWWLYNDADRNTMSNIRNEDRTQLIICETEIDTFISN